MTCLNGDKVKRIAEESTSKMTRVWRNPSLRSHERNL